MKNSAAGGGLTGWCSPPRYSPLSSAALGGALVGWILALVDYLPNRAQQSAGVLTTINALFTLIPSALFLSMALLLCLYKLSSRRVAEIASELAQKRQHHEDTPPLVSAIQE